MSWFICFIKKFLLVVGILITLASVYSSSKLLQLLCNLNLSTNYCTWIEQSVMLVFSTKKNALFCSPGMTSMKKDFTISSSKVLSKLQKINHTKNIILFQKYHYLVYQLELWATFVVCAKKKKKRIMIDAAKYWTEVFLIS